MPTFEEITSGKKRTTPEGVVVAPIPEREEFFPIQEPVDFEDISPEELETFQLIQEPAKGIFKGKKRIAQDFKGGEFTGEFLESDTDTFWDRAKNMFSDTDKAAAQATLAIVDAEMQNIGRPPEERQITPSQAMMLKNQIDKGVKLNPSRAALRSDLKTIVKMNLERGYGQVNLGMWASQALMGDNSPETMDAIKQTQEGIPKEEEMPYPTTLAQELGQSTAEMLPFLAEATKRGAWRGLILGGGTWLMGSATGVPTYPLVPAMYAVGQTSASLEFVSKVEGGLAYMDMIDYVDPKTKEKVNPEVARAAAFGVGTINGLLELAQIKTLVNTFPGGKKLFAGIISDTIKEVVESQGLKNIMATHVSRYGSTLVKETVQELAQESTNITAEILSRRVTNALDKTNLSDPKKKDIIDRLTQTAKQSAQAFSVISLPGPVISGGTKFFQSKKGEGTKTRADKIFKASLFSDIKKAQTGQGKDRLDITPEEIQTFINDPKKSDIKEEDLDAIIAENDLDAFTERLIDTYHPELKDEILFQKPIASQARTDIQSAVESHPNYTPEMATDFMKVWDGIANSMVESGDLKQAEDFYELMKFEVGGVPSQEGVFQAATEIELETMSSINQEIESDIILDGTFDRTALNKGPLYSITPQSGEFQGRTVTVEELTPEAVSEKIGSIDKVLQQTEPEQIADKQVEFQEKGKTKKFNLSDIKKVKSFETDEGSFSMYDIEPDVRGRVQMFTVLEDEGGYIVRNAFVPDSLQRQGVSTYFYQKMNKESIGKTGNPLRSTRPRTLSTGETVHELTPDAIAMWDSFVNKGLAEKKGEKLYNFITSETEVFQTEPVKTDTPAFKNWFGDSKVVDDKGEPLVVYHGTDADISEFRKSTIGTAQEGRLFNGEGFYFSTNKRDASLYGENVIETYLSAENILDLSDKDVFIDAFSEIIPRGSEKTLGEINKEFGDASKGLEIEDVLIQEWGGGGAAGFKDVQWKIDGEWHSTGRPVSPLELSDDPTGFKYAESRILPKNPKDINHVDFTPDQITEAAKSNGYDGIKGDGSIGTTGDEYVVFEPTQIKSTESVAFDPQDPRILFQESSDSVENISKGNEEFNLDENKKNQDGDTGKIYHTGTDKIKKISKDGTFGDVLFFSKDEYIMTASPDYFVYSMKEPENTIETKTLFFEHEPSEFQDDFNHVMSTLGVDEETAEGLLEDSIDTSDSDFVMDTVLDLGEAGWFIQQKQGEIARKLGYDAAVSTDEQGEVFIISMFGRENELSVEATVSDGKRIEATGIGKEVNDIEGRLLFQEGDTIHTMPDGTIMPGKEHEGSVEGSERKATVEDVPRERVLFQEGEKEDGIDKTFIPSEAVKTPAFNAWFGDSKVVNEEGKPLVVFHGGAEKITEFDEGFAGDTTANNEYGAFFFTDNKRVGEDYSRQAFIRRYEDRDIDELIDFYDVTKEQAGKIVEDVDAQAEEQIKTVDAYLQMENPLIIDFEGETLDTEKAQRYINFAKNKVDEVGDIFEELIDEAGIDPDIIEDFKPEIEERARENNDLEETDTIEDYMLEDAQQEILDENDIFPEIPDYDGVIFKDVVDDISPESSMAMDEYVVFDSTQIKSIYNRGTFSINDPRILFQKGKQPLGQIENLFTEDPVLIKLFSGANASTPIHETGHFLTKILHNTRPEDYNILADWVGVDKERAEQGIDAWNTEELEKSAKAFEAYVMEGKAPTKELKPVFERLKQWLIDVYKTVQTLGVEISPEVRKVFDRLVSPAKKQEKSLWSAIQGFGGIKFEQGLKGFPKGTGLLSKKETGLTIDEMDTKLKEEGWIREDESISDLIKAGGLKRREKIRREINLERIEGLGGREALSRALKVAAQDAKKAQAEGNIQGFEEGKARIRALIEKSKTAQALRSDAKKIKTRILNEIKKTKVKKQSGKPKGRFGAERQETLDILRENVGLTQTAASEKLIGNLEKYTTEYPPESIAFENRLLDMQSTRAFDVTDQTLQDWGKLLSDIKDFKAQGVLSRELKSANRAALSDFYRREVIETVGGIPTGIESVGEEAVTDRTLKTRMRNAVFAGGAFNIVAGWKDILDVISFKDKASKAFESPISKFGDVLDTKNAEKLGNMEVMEGLRDIIFDVYQLKSDRQMVKMFEKDSILQDLGTFTNLRGELVDLKLSRGQARKRVMEILDPTLHNTIFSIEGMAWTEEMVVALRGLLNPNDEEFIAKQMEFYQEYYKGVNEVYSEIYGVNLPQNDFYSPISREGVKKDDAGLGEFIKEMPARASVTSGSLKSRTQNLFNLQARMDVDVLMSHVSEMEHFKAWAEKIRELNSVFSDPEVRQAIRINYGKSVDAHIQNFIKAFAQGGAETAQNVAGIDRIRSQYTKSVLAVKPTLFLKQLTSAIAYADSIPVGQFAKEFIKLHELKKGAKILMESTLMKDRWTKGSIERDIKAATSTEEFSAFRTSPSFSNALMALVKMGDAGAIIAGGYPVYKYHRKQGKTHEEALKIFEQVTESTQQSSDLSEQSSWQRGGSFAKLFTMFMSSPNQYFRKEVGAIRNLIAGRATKSQVLKTVVIYHILLPMLFQWVSDRFTWDEEEQTRAMTLGPLNGYFIAGEALNYLVREALDMKTFEPSVPIYQIPKDFGKALDLISPDELEPEEFLRAVRGLAGATGGLTGLPLKQVVDYTVGISDTLSGDYEIGIAELMGYSPFKAEKAAEEE